MPTPRRLTLDPLEPRLVPDATIPPLEPGLVSGRVWADADADGLLDATESGVAGVTVEVRSEDGTDLIAGGTTAADGGYSFPLPVGDYVLKVVPPADHGLTKTVLFDLSGLPTSKVGTATGTADFAADGTNPATVNAGLVRTAAPGRGNDFAFGFAKAIDKGQPAGRNPLAVDAGGNTYLIGFVASTVNPIDPIRDPYLAKYDLAGKLVWRKPVGADGYVPQAVAVDPAGNAYVTGVTAIVHSMGVVDAPPPAGPRPDVFVEKFAADGTAGWRKTFGEDGADWAEAVVADAAGNVFVGGTIGTAGSDLGRPWLVKLAAATGEAVWTRAVAGADTGIVRSIVADGQGGAWFAGAATPADGMQAAVVGRVDTAGTVQPLWRLSGAAGSYAFAAGLARDAGGNLYVAGEFGGTVDFDPTAGVANRPADSTGYSDVFVAKLGPDGKPAWVKAVGGEFYDHVAGFERGPDGAVYLTGSFSGTADFDPGSGAIPRTGFDTPFFLELDSAGAFVRVQVSPQYAAAGWLIPGPVKADAAGRLHLAGGYQGTPDADPTGGVSVLPGDAGSYLAMWARKNATPPNTRPTVTPLAPLAIREGQSLSLAVVATDADHDSLTVAWDLNGDGIYRDAGGATLNLTWSQLQYFGITDSGPARPIGARVSDGKSPAVLVNTTLTVKNAAPTAPLSLAGAITEGGIGKVVYGKATDATAADRAAGFRYSYDLDNDGKWDVGDGRTFAGGVTDTSAVIPPALLVNSGTRVVKARVFDKDGGYTETKLTVPVRNAAPRATFRVDGPVNEGSPATVRFGGVTDASPADTKAGFRYSYDFNNDGVYEVGDGKTFAGSVATATARVPGTFLKDNGTYPVRARVFDKDGGSAEYITVVRVNNVAPAGLFAPAGTAVAGRPAAFAFTNVTDAGVRDVAAGFKYWLDWNNNGTFEQSGPTPQVTYTFAQAGTYTVHAKVTDKDGGMKEFSLNVVVSAAGPDGG